MILKIGEFLFLPKREINRGFHATGYAPAYRELPTEHEDLKPVFRAIEKMLKDHMPYPAIVLNQNWDVVKTNSSAKELMIHLGYSKHENLVEALISDNSDTSKIVNWSEQVSIVLMRLRYEISMLNGSSRLEELEKELSESFTPALTDDAINIDASFGYESLLTHRCQEYYAIVNFSGQRQGPDITNDADCNFH